MNNQNKSKNSSNAQVKVRRVVRGTKKQQAPRPCVPLYLG